jgi:hypothetical protein
MIDKISLILRIISICVSYASLIYDIRKMKEREFFRTIEKAARRNGVKFSKEYERA